MEEEEPVPRVLDSTRFLHNRTVKNIYRELNSRTKTSSIKSIYSREGNGLFQSKKMLMDTQSKPSKQDQKKKQIKPKISNQQKSFASRKSAGTASRGTSLKTTSSKSSTPFRAKGKSREDRRKRIVQRLGVIKDNLKAKNKNRGIKEPPTPSPEPKKWREIESDSDRDSMLEINPRDRDLRSSSKISKENIRFKEKKKKQSVSAARRAQVPVSYECTIPKQRVAHTHVDQIDAYFSNSKAKNADTRKTTSASQNKVSLFRSVSNSKKIRTNSMKTKARRKVKDRKIVSNEETKINLNIFIDLDLVLWNLYLLKRPYKDLETLFKSYLYCSNALCTIYHIFPEDENKGLVRKLRAAEEYIVAFFSNIKSSPELQGIKLKVCMKYVCKNYILMLEMVIDQIATLFRTNTSFVKLKRLISKRKIYFELPSLISKEIRARLISKNFKYIRTVINEALDNHVPLKEEIERFFDEVNKIKSGKSDLKLLSRYFSNIGAKYGVKEIDDATSEEVIGLISILRDPHNPATNKDDHIVNVISQEENRIKELEETKIEERMTVIESKLGKILPISSQKDRSTLLPQIHPKYDYTLVLDLDETLIHFKENEGEEGQFYVRPHARNFLKEMSQFYEIVIFTAATKEYADWVLDRIDDGGSISHRLYRQHTLKDSTNSPSIKDLSLLGRDISKMLIIDNIADNFSRQPENGIVIRSWRGEAQDEALKHLSILLRGRTHLITPELVIRGVEDVREALKEMRDQIIQNMLQEIKENH